MADKRGRTRGGEGEGSGGRGRGGGRNGEVLHPILERGKPENRVIGRGGGGGIFQIQMIGYFSKISLIPPPFHLTTVCFSPVPHCLQICCRV